jgi:hypothetical protein
MNFILNHSQYKHECEVEQHREDVQMYSSSKLYDRHTDNSLLGSVRRRLIAPKLRAQHSTTPPPTAIIISPSSTPNNAHESKSKTRSTTMDLKRSSSKESMTTNGKMISMFSLSKVKSKVISFEAFDCTFTLQNPSPRIEKSNANRSLLEAENADSLLRSFSNLYFHLNVYIYHLSPRSKSKLATPLTCSSTPSDNFNSNGDSYLLSTEFDFSKLATDDIDHDSHNQLALENLQSTSKDGKKINYRLF